MTTLERGEHSSGSALPGTWYSTVHNYTGTPQFTVFLRATPTVPPRRNICPRVAIWSQGAQHAHGHRLPRPCLLPRRALQEGGSIDGLTTDTSSVRPAGFPHPHTWQPPPGTTASMASMGRIPTMRARNTQLEEEVNGLTSTALASGILFHDVGAGRPCLKCGE